MRLNCKTVLLCAMLFMLVCVFTACGKKTEFEKVEVFETEPVSEMQTAAVDAVPVITEPISQETASETTTRRAKSKRNNTQNENPPVESPADGEGGEVPPEVPDTPHSPETPDTPQAAETPSMPTQASTEPATEPSESIAPTE